MNNNQTDKTLFARTGKDLLTLIRDNEHPSQKQQVVASCNDIEIVLYNLWQSLLGHERFGVNDDFFKFGGNSLKAIQLLSRISSHFSVDIILPDIFLHPTIAQMAILVSEKSVNTLSRYSSIAVSKRPEYIPLSFGQERLWFIDKLKGSLQYHLPSILTLKGKLDKDALIRGLKHIVNRHEVLRTVILEEQGKSYQSVKEKDGWQISLTDGTAYKNNKSGLQQYITELVTAPFNLSGDYMLRADLIGIEELDHLLVVTIHHIASDGWSISTIIKELSEVYAAVTQGRPIELPSLPVQYADYAIWQRKQLQGTKLDVQLGYWKNKLLGGSSLQLPTDYPRSAIQSTRGAVTKFQIDKELTEHLKLLSYQQGATLFMTLLTTFNVLLHRYSGQQDICIGTPIAGRNHQEVENLIGFFINSLALRSDLSNDPSFISLLQQVKTTTLEAYANQEVPFEKVVDAVGSNRDMSRNPLFQVLFTMHNTPEIPELRLGEMSLSVEQYELHTSQLDIICNISETAQGMNGVVEYCTDLFTEQTIQRLMGHFKQLLYAVVQSPNGNIGALPMLSQKEQHKLLVEFNGNNHDYQEPKTIIHLFEDQVIINPDNTAVVFEEKQITYRQLNERANQLAHYLKLLGVKEQQLVPVCIERSDEMLVIILAIFKAGAAYIPIDPTYPEKRIGYVLQDAGASLVITNTNSEANLPTSSTVRYLIIDGDMEQLLICRQSLKNLQEHIALHQLAYVIYTSGSTGKPKGVMIEHESLCSYMLNNKTRYINDSSSFTGSFVHLSYTSDASLTGMFMPLLYGKSIVIGSNQTINVFEDNNLEKYAPYDFIKITPSHLELLRPKFRTSDGNLITTKLVIGGEALLPGQLQYFIEEGLNITIVNEYGPTEATVGCSVYSFDTLQMNGMSAGKPNGISIGKPIDNVKLYILGDNNELVPPGVAGELCVSGPGLARAYLNSANLTAEKFIKNPFNKQTGSRIYKTGDIASWYVDGNIQYLGRKDDQVKIRGHRVELGEIESVLTECVSLRQAVVLAKENNDAGKRLVAYVVPETVFEREEIISYLATKLPEYMIPAQWVTLEAIPLTINGKIDRKALPEPDASAFLRKQYAAPRSEVEMGLAQIWQELLGVETVGINDSFFELGGHSLMVVKMLSIIKKKFHLLIPIQVMFKFSTINELAGYIEWQNDSTQEEDDTTPFELIQI